MAATVAALLVVGLVAYRLASGNAHLWLPGYVLHTITPRPNPQGTRHVMFLFADHYEPGPGEPGVEANRTWLQEYRALAGRHRDSYGRRPQHTWFYAYDEHNDGVIPELSRAVHDGLGEIELHWHHSYDTNQTFPGKLAEAVAWFNSYGAMVSSEGKVAFGFIHGKWALDNSLGADMCGVTWELDILKKAGCYGDFTFPIPGNPAQPRKVNTIYYATDDERSKSYDTGTVARVGQRNPGGFMIMEGPLVVRFAPPLREGAGVDEGHEFSPARVDDWVETGISVEGRPEWIFVKVYSHGIQARSIVFSAKTDQMFSHLETKYGSGAYRLHYVNAREAYNIVRAAEDGRAGDPDQYRDYEIGRPLNMARQF